MPVSLPIVILLLTPREPPHQEPEDRHQETNAPCSCSRMIRVSGCPASFFRFSNRTGFGSPPIPITFSQSLENSFADLVFANSDASCKSTTANRGRLAVPLYSSNSLPRYPFSHSRTYQGITSPL